MTSGSASPQQEVRTSRVDWGVGGGLYDTVETDDPATAVAWVQDLPPLDLSLGPRRVVGVAFRWRNTLDGRLELHTLYLSHCSRVLLLRLRGGIASLPADVAGFMMSPINLFVGDDLETAAGVLHDATGGDWMPKRKDLLPLAALRRSRRRVDSSRPHEVMARTLLDWPEEYLVRTVGSFSYTEDDLEVQSCVVAQHVVQCMWWPHRYIRGRIDSLRWPCGRRAQ